jgi:hypothetical protein
MKFIKIIIPFLVLFVSNSFGQKPALHESSQNKNLSDSIVFDLNQAIYSTVSSVNYIEIPVWIKSTNASISSFDFWFQFDASKLTYVSTSSLVAGLDAFSNFNINNSYLSNTSSGASIDFVVPLNTNLIKLKFSINGLCTTILPADFYNITTLINGEVSSKKITEDTSTFDILTPSPFCSNAFITFNCANNVNGKPIQNYLWNFGNSMTSTNSEDSTTYLNSNNYQITLDLTTTDGCFYTFLKQISVTESPQASFTYTWTPNLSSVICTNTSTISNGTIISNNWDFGDGSTATITNPTHTYTSLGSYILSLEVVSDLGCASTYSVEISNVNEIEEYSLMEIYCYPNPSDNILHIPLNKADIIYVYDCFGRLIFSKELNKSCEQLELITRDFEAGRYFVEILSDQKMERGSFVVKHF